MEPGYENPKFSYMSMQKITLTAGSIPASLFFVSLYLNYKNLKEKNMFDQTLLIVPGLLRQWQTSHLFQVTGIRMEEYAKS